MDPRFRRSQTALRTAVLELSATRPARDLGVTEVCQHAGLTRDTFYRHAISPVELLADALAERLAEIVRATEDPTGGVRLDAGFRGAERALLGHVAEYAATYRNAMEPRLAAPLRANLEDIVRNSLVRHLRRYPATLPRVVDPADEAAVELVAAFSAAGTVGAMEVWLRDEPLDVDRGVELILAASPRFWFTVTGESTGGSV